MDARARADVHDIIGATHGILVVLDHDDRIAEVTEIFQRCDEFIVVALVQTDGRLIQYIQHTRQGASDLGGQADALALAAGQGACRPGQCEVIEAHALQKLQAVLDLLHDLAADLLLLFGQVRLIVGDEFQLVPNRHFAEIADVFAANGHSQHHRFQALTMAVGTLDARHEAADFLLHPLAVRLAEAALEVLDDALKGIIIDAAAELIRAVHLDSFFVGAVEQGVDSLGAHFFDGRIQRKAVFFAQSQIIHLGYRAFGVVPAAGLDSPLPNREVPVGQDALFVHPHEGAEAGTLLAGTQRVIEGEEPG